MAPFLNDPRFGQQAYNISEPFVARQAGGDPQVLMLADAGYNPYTSCLVTRDELVRRSPDLVRRVVAGQSARLGALPARPGRGESHGSSS